MSSIHELYGRQAELLQRVIEEREATFALLINIKRGELDPADILLTKTGWTIRQSGDGGEAAPTPDTEEETL